MSVADLLGEHIGANETILARVTGIRPIRKGLSDQYPYLVYETAAMNQVESLNRKSNTYVGVIRLYVVAITQGECGELAELIKDYLNDNPTAANADYQIRRSRMEDEEDIAQDEDDDGNAFYVKSIDWWVRGRKLRPTATPSSSE